MHHLSDEARVKFTLSDHPNTEGIWQGEQDVELDVELGWKSNALTVAGVATVAFVAVITLQPELLPAAAAVVGITGAEEAGAAGVAVAAAEEDTALGAAARGTGQALLRGARFARRMRQARQSAIEAIENEEGVAGSCL